MKKIITFRNNELDNCLNFPEWNKANDYQLISSNIEDLKKNKVFIIDLDSFPKIKRIPAFDIYIYLRYFLPKTNAYSFYFVSSNSFQDWIKQDVAHLIFTAPGNRFIQNDKPINDEDLLKKCKIVDYEYQELVPYYKATIDMEAHRHKVANIWGIHRLNAAYNTIHNNTIDSSNNGSLSLEYALASLSYLSIEKETIHQNDNLTNNYIKEISVFLEKTKDNKILYIDDLASQWAPTLQKVLGITGEKFKFIEPTFNEKEKSLKDIASDFLKAIKAIIKDFQPDIILLDLRLTNKDEQKPNEYTGAYLARNLKNAFSSIPILMFTASNKAENLRIALNNGCDNLWSKEGIDSYEGMRYSIKNYWALLSMVERATSKFKDEFEKRAYETDIFLEKLKAEKTVEDDFKNIFDTYKTIIVDTCYILTITNNVTNLIGIKNIAKLLYQAKLYNENQDNKVKILLLQEVFLELFIHSKKNIEVIKLNKNKEQSKIEEEILAVKCARYFMNIFYSWLEQGIIELENFNRKDNPRFRKTFSNGTDDINNNANTDDIHINETKNEPHWLDEIFRNVKSRINAVKNNVDESIKEEEKTNNDDPIYADKKLLDFIINNINKENIILLTTDKKLVKGILVEKVNGENTDIDYLINNGFTLVQSETETKEKDTYLISSTFKKDNNTCLISKKYYV